MSMEISLLVGVGGTSENCGMLTRELVDGGQWHTSGVGGGHFKYPDFLLSGETVSGVKGLKTKKSKL